MEKIVAPNHIQNYCNNVDEDLFLNNIKQEYGGEFSFVYKVVCDCKNDKFNLYKNNNPSLFAECSLCKKRITIYELSRYPAAVKLDKKYDLNCITDYESELYVNYEYSDEFIYEEDVQFDNNDITWARAFIMKDNNIIKVLDDETA